MLCYIESVAAPLEVMAFACHEFPLGLTILSLEIRLFSANPSEARDDSQSYGFVIEIQRRRHPNTSVRRIYAQMKVLDVLADNFDRRSPYVDEMASHLSNPVDSLRFRICGLRGRRCH